MSHFSVPHMLDAIGIGVGLIGWFMAYYLGFITDPEEIHQGWPFVFFAIGTFFIARHIEALGADGQFITFMSFLTILAGLVIQVVLFHLIIEENGSDRPTERLADVLQGIRDALHTLTRKDD